MPTYLGATPREFFNDYVNKGNFSNILEHANKTPVLKKCIKGQLKITTQ